MFIKLIKMEPASYDGKVQKLFLIICVHLHNGYLIFGAQLFKAAKKIHGGGSPAEQRPSCWGGEVLHVLLRHWGCERLC